MIYIPDSSTKGMRLDAYLASVAEISRSAAARLIEAGEVTVDGTRVEKKYAVCEGNVIEPARSASAGGCNPLQWGDDRK